MKYPVYQPSIGAREKELVNECLDTTWISSKGRFVDEFEQQFSSYLDCTYSTTVSNGTVAIHLALVALGIGTGDEVIVPTFTYIASVNPMIYVGAEPVFVDSLEETWQVDPEAIRAAITPKTKAIMVVHLYGHPCDMEAIMAIAKEHNLFVIEDCAEALGTEYKGQKVGTFGDVATFSFFGNKTVTTGEGGMVVTNDTTLHDRLVRYKGQGLAKFREYWHDIVGYNFRMTNICAAIGIAQLERVEETLNRKRKISDLYESCLAELPVTCHRAHSDDLKHSYWMNSILLENASVRDEFRDILKAEGIETRPTFYPVHTMPMYSSVYQRHRVAEEIASRGMNLPSYPCLTDEDVREICSVIKKALVQVGEFKE